MNTIYTIGHSTHPIEKFLQLLEARRVEVVVDVRSSPFSKRFPQFSREALQGSLRQQGIRYLFLGRELGARRREPEAYVGGKADYRLIATLPTFQEGIVRVLGGAKDYRIALMCAEQDPLTCHRTILVCRALKPHGPRIEHLLRDGSAESHEEAETRLMLEEGEKPGQGDIFASASGDTDVALDRAYDRRGGRIAYQEEANDDEDSHDRLHQEKR